MKILALDMASKIGFAVDGLPGGPPLTGTYEIYGGGSVLGTAFYLFQGWLYDAVALHEAGAIAYEAPWIRPTDTADLIQLLFGLSTCAMAMAAAHHIPFYPVKVNTARKHFVGHGAPKDPKETVMARCRQLGWTPATHDESDACAVWDWAKATHDPTFRYEATTPLFKGGIA